MRLGRIILLAVTVTASSIAMQVTPAAAQVPAEGDVRLVKRTDSAFDRFTREPTADMATWMRDKYWRIETFTPYWDSKTSWYGDTWIYKDLYAIHTDSELARTHPEWILRDGSGNKLFIPWGCSNGTCPQYAADPGNPDFRRWWVDSARAGLSKGHKGLWIDDVNMEFRVGDGNGRELAPVDARTGGTMSASSWRRYVAEFTEQITAGLPPETEILHNAIWYGGNSVGRDQDESVRRQLAAADIVNLERGVIDDGLTGGTGDWSLKTFLAYVDRRHAEGKAVVLDQWAETPSDREYGLAAYFLISNGLDGVGNGTGTSPDDWWRGYDVTLGAAKGPRYEWNGVLRRDFANGVVLLNEPGAPQRTLAVGDGLTNVDGVPTSTVTLGGRRGAVLLGPAAAVPTAPVVAAPVTKKPKPNPPRKASTSVTLEAVPLTTLSAFEAPADDATAPGRAPVARPAVRGKVTRAKGGRVRLEIQRRVVRRWRTAKRVTRTLDARGRFSRVLPRLRPGRYRVRAVFLGTSTMRSSRSTFRRFTVRP